jgi:hypothetical protein
MITNKNIIKQIERDYNVSLIFEEIDCYGLYCKIQKIGKSGLVSKKVNVYDAQNCKELNKFLLRDFLTNGIYDIIGD